ncbi:MAG TPA: trigger factor [Thermoanaerobaculia bacterium]|jgi:trigger factor|nr:trigger factor [Thermoanaerobaculia bacterium]
MAILATKDESSTRTVLEIEVPAEDVQKAFDAVTRSYVKRAAIPGFRKGKAPESVISKRFADEIKGDVLEAVLPDALAAAIEERKLSVLGRPHIEDLKWEPPGPMRFAARLDLKPAVDPGEYKGIVVEDVGVEPGEDEVTKVIERIREAHAEFHPIEGRAAAPGDFAVADIGGSFIEILAPGQNPRTFRDEKITLEVGHADSMPEINEALRGAVPGETRKFRKTFADDFPNDEFRSKTVDYDVTLAALKEKKLPALDDEFARAVSEGDTVETLREKVRTRLRREKEAERRRRFRRSILEALVASKDIPAPEVLVESETAAALRDYARYLAQSGVDPEKEDWEKLQAEARPGAEKRVREYLLLDAIAEREGIQVSETELEAEFKRAAAERGVEVAVLREQMAKAGGIDALRDEMRLAKAVDLLIASAKVLPSGMPVEVK